MIFQYSIFFQKWRQHGIRVSLLNFAKQGYYVIKNHDMPTCPDCGAKLIPRGSKKLFLKNENSEAVEYRLKRLFCPSCKKLHIELPFHDAIPYRQYSKQTFDAVRAGDSDGFAGDNRTISRWKNLK